MKIQQNLHIHSMHSCDSACASLDDIQKEMSSLGMIEYGISDHVHSKYNLCDLEGARNDFFACKRPPEFHLGVEMSTMPVWMRDNIASGNYQRLGDDPIYGLFYNPIPENADFSPVLDLDENDMKRLEIEYVICGVHMPLNPFLQGEEMIEETFRQNMFIIEHPLVDIFAHPWDGLAGRCVWRDWLGLTGKGRFNRSILDYSVFEKLEPYNEKMLEALLKHNTAVEINCATMTNPMLPEKVRKILWNMLAQWREAGVKFTIGNDLHAAHSCRSCFGAMELLLDAYGFKEDDIRYLFAGA